MPCAFAQQTPNAQQGIDSKGQWEGTTEKVVFDDFEHHRSKTQWYLQTENGKVPIVFSKNSPRRSGMKIRIQGARTANGIAVTSFTLAAAPQVQKCTTTGAQNVAVVMVTTPSNPSFPSGFTPSYFQQEFFGSGAGSLNTESLNGFWAQTSYNQTSATGQVVGPFALSQNYTCDQLDDLTTAAIAAADSTIDFTQFTRIAIVFPIQSCSYSGFNSAGVGSIGCSTETSPSKGNLTASVAWLPIFPNDETTLKLATFAHEFGHNLGLDHASSDDYSNIPLGPPGNPGSTIEYGDSFSVMGADTTFNNEPIAGQYSAEHKALDLGWLSLGDYQEVTSSGAFTLVPFENDSGLRALRILRDASSGAWLWVEFRQPIGDVDSSFSLWESVGETNVFQGALIHYEDPSLDPLHTYLLDFNPSSAPNNFLKPVLLPGQTWSDPNSLLSLTVNSANSSGLSLTVNYDQPCATVSASPLTFDTSGGTGTITITAASSCSWTASSAATWLVLNGSTSGQGNGSISFSVQANGGAQRSAYLTVQRQSLRIVQAGTGLSALTLNPVTGTGSSGQFTFTFSDTSGYSDISYVELYFSDDGGEYVSGGAPQCEVDLYPAGYLWLTDGTGNQAGPLYLNQPGQSISNGQCTVYSSGTSVSGSGNQLSVTAHVDFSPSFAGTHRISAAGVTSGAGATQAIALGTWNVSPLNNVSAALHFVPITPCRVIDTRNQDAFSGTSLVGGAARDYTIPGSANINSSNCPGVSIPATALAYSMNVTVLPNKTLSFLTVYPKGRSRPNVSTLNSYDGRVKSTAAIVGADSTGTISFYATDDTELVVDVDGYFVSSADAGFTSDLAYYPVTPCRIADTRNANGPLGGPQLGYHGQRDFPILSSPCAANIPASVKAYSINIAAVPAGGQPLIYLTAWPTGITQPVASVLNAVTGAITSNAVIVPAGTDANHSVSIYASNATDVVIDIDGYFAAPATGGLSLYAITPCRVLDTRNPTGASPFSGTIVTNFLNSSCSVPATAQAYVLGATVIPESSLSYLTLWSQGQTPPLESTLNADDQAVTSNLAIIPSTGSVSAYASSSTYLILDIFGYFAP